MSLWPFKKKEKKGFVVNGTEDAIKIEPVLENLLPFPEKTLDLHIGKLIFLDTVPWYITNIFPKDNSITLRKLTPAQWKKLQESAREIAIAAVKKKNEEGNLKPNAGEAGIAG